MSQKAKPAEPLGEAVSDDRGSGRTTAQLKNAPKEALFIWCNDDITYPSVLARSLGRTDLRIRPLTALIDLSRVVGLQYTAVVLDHAARDDMTTEHYQGYRWLQKCARPPMENAQ